MRVSIACLAFCACTAVSATSLDEHHQRLFNAALAPDFESYLVLDTTEDGILEVEPRVFGEPDPFLASSDEDDLDAMPRWAMAYTPYTAAGECKAAANVQKDAATIAARGFTALRLFSTDCDILPSLSDTARNLSLKLIPTVYISEAGINDSVEEQIQDLLSFAQWDLISMVSIGNEALFYRHCSADDLGSLLATSTTRLRAAGYTGPITTIDHAAMIKLHSEQLCPHLHVLASSVQPFFDGSIRARDAGRFLAQSLDHLARACGDVRDSYILEVGWPRKGRVNGDAVPGRREQRMALQEMLRTAGHRIALATFEDELWREPGEFSAEQFWGCADLFSAKGAARMDVSVL